MTPRAASPSDRYAPGAGGSTSAGLSDLERKVARVMALLWVYRPCSKIQQVLTSLKVKRQDGRAITLADIHRTVAVMCTQKYAESQPGREGSFRLNEAARRIHYREVLTAWPIDQLEATLDDIESPSYRRLGYRGPIYDQAAAVAQYRLALHSGASPEALGDLSQRIRTPDGADKALWDAVYPAFDPELFERITAEWRWSLAHRALRVMSQYWEADLVPVAEWALGQVRRAGTVMPTHVALALAEVLLFRGDPEGAQRVLGDMTDPFADALRAGALVQAGRWPEGEAAFAATLKRLQVGTGSRKRLLPESLAWLYPLALLAQQTPAHLELARKFCRSEAGARQPDPRRGWGMWLHAIEARLGETALDPQIFAPTDLPPHYIDLNRLWNLLLAAWLGRDVLRGKAAPGGKTATEASRCEALRARLQPCGFTWLLAQVDAAQAVLEGREPTTPFFVAGPREQWRDVLSALQALGTKQETSAAGGDDATRIVWLLDIDAAGALKSITPLEQRRGARGFGKSKPLSLGKLAGNERLPPWDAKVVRAIRTEGVNRRGSTLDRAAAIVALVGHPAVALAGAPEQFIDLVEGTPEVEVIRENERFVLRVTPPVRPDDDTPELGYVYEAATRREQEALRMITLVPDSPQRWRVIRFTAAQRRAAQLVSGSLSVPAAAHDALQQALRALASHFDVHADHAEAAREVAAEPRLRAELAPVGTELSLRLVVAPLGPAGPRVMPGHGRVRLMAAVAGEAIGTQRDLAAERAQLDVVLDALPFLDEGGMAACDWLIADPEQALEVVETLPKLAAVAAVDWPKGKAVRVKTVDASKLGIVVKSQRDWFQVTGRAAVDEGLVLDLETLLAASTQPSRFVPMGEGVYVALTRSLKQRLTELAAVAEFGRDGVRVPRPAAAWLGELLDGIGLEVDADFRAALERLQQAQDEVPTVPATLQTELRAYQEDGYRWAMRLAHAGLGGCLADDMGLGKTLQALAVLLARGAGGPALVVAPTSVCGNWMAEAQRFAPTLKFALYGEGERETMVAEAGPLDVICVSYALLQQAGERFAARTWHTVIADEAQAIKNATAKRSLAAFEVPADFRLALTGTPVENRLAELWSIMRFANPGLLGPLSRFTERFAGPIERDRDRDVQHRLRRLIGPFVLRRTKTQVLQELPPRTELVVAVTPSAAEAAHYEALRRQAQSEVDEALAGDSPGQARMNILAQLTRLRRAACDPRLVSPQLGFAGAKVQAFADIAADLVANGHKALVFSQFVDFLTLLRAPLDQAGIAYQYLDGSTPAAERTNRVNAFQLGAGELFLISLKAGGFGLNLTAADYVLITDPWWNPAAEDQAMGRAHRMGQARPVTVYRLVTRGTVEERIVELHHDKRALAESLLADTDAPALPSAEDLIALMRE